MVLFVVYFLFTTKISMLMQKQACLANRSSKETIVQQSFKLLLNYRSSYRSKNPPQLLLLLSLEASIIIPIYCVSRRNFLKDILLYYLCRKFLLLLELGIILEATFCLGFRHLLTLFKLNSMLRSNTSCRRHLMQKYQYLICIIHVKNFGYALIQLQFWKPRYNGTFRRLFAMGWQQAGDWWAVGWQLYLAEQK